MTHDFDTKARQVLAAAKLLYERNMVNAYEGNVSVRLGDSLLITPSQVCKAELTPQDLVEVDIATGETVIANNGRAASSEAKMHICCYLARPDIQGIAHAHPPAATAFALCGLPIETGAYPEMMILYGKVPICRYGRPGTQAVCDDIPGVLSDYDTFLLANHGLTAVGASPIEAAYRLEAIESIARVLLNVRALGPEATLSKREIIELEALRVQKRREYLGETDGK